MQKLKWTVYAFFVFLNMASSGCQKMVLHQWPLISALWPGDNSDDEPLKMEDVQEFPGSSNQAEISSLMSLAYQAELEKNDSRAEAAYRKVLSKAPNNPEAHHRLAIIADNQKEFDLSEHHYKKALESLPGSPELLNDFGYSLFLQKRYKESEHFLQQALNVAPNNRRALTNLALVQGTMGDRDEAMETLLKIHSPKIARRVLNRLFPQNRTGGTIELKTEKTPTVSIEGVLPLPMNDRPATSPLAQNRNNVSGDPLSSENSSSSIIQIPLSEPPVPRPPVVTPQAPAAGDNFEITGISNKKIRQASFRNSFTNRTSEKNVFYQGPDAEPFGVQYDSTKSESLKTYYRKAILLGHNVGHEGLLFPAFESTNKRK